MVRPSLSKIAGRFERFLPAFTRWSAGPRPRKSANKKDGANIPFARTAKPDVRGRDYARHGVQKPPGPHSGGLFLYLDAAPTFQCLSVSYSEETGSSPQ